MKYFLGIILLSFIILPASGYERIFYEDCEDSSFSNYFLERHFGTNYLTYWNELTSELTRSTVSHNGLYSMTYNPWVDGNPHSVAGVANLTYGNTSNFNLQNFNGRYWYFRWFQRWESNTTYDGENKLIYLNYNGSGDFTFTFKKTGSDSFHITILDRATYSLVDNPWPRFSGGSVDDERWHKMELFIDAGTSNASNGSYYIKIDDTTLYENSNLRLNSTINPNPMEMITGWPSNTSGESGTQNTWLDDQEIYILNSPDDIPPIQTSTPAVKPEAPTNFRSIN